MTVSPKKAMFEVLCLPPLSMFKAVSNIGIARSQYNKVLSTEFDHTYLKPGDFKVAEDFRKLVNNKYDKLIRPNYTGAAIDVNIAIHIHNLGSISEKLETFTIEFSLFQFWSDHRLRHKSQRKLTPLIGRSTAPQLIWTPDTYFINAKHASKQLVTTTNEKLDIYPNGTVFWGQRIRMTASCKMNFISYPMDIQICGLFVESYSYNNRHIRYRWYNRAITYPSKEVSQFVLVDVRTSSTNVAYAEGIYSILKGEFVIQRKISTSVLFIFMPVSSIVVISWISFWLHKNCVSARIGLGITSILVTCGFWGASNRALPRVNYVKAVDVYFIATVAFIFLTMLEYVFVINMKFYLRKSKKRKYDEQQREKDKSLESIELDELPTFRTKSFFDTENFNNIIKRKKEKGNKTKKSSNKRQRKISQFQRLRERKSSMFVFPTADDTHASNRGGGGEENEDDIPIPTHMLLDNRGRHRKSFDQFQCKLIPSDNDFLWPKVRREEMPYFYKGYPVQGKPTSLDVMSRFFYPFLYICFNVWFYQTYHPSHDEILKHYFDK